MIYVYSLNKVTFPHHPVHPSSKGIGIIYSLSPEESSVKQKNLNFHVVFLAIPAYSLLT